MKKILIGTLLGALLIVSLMIGKNESKAADGALEKAIVTVEIETPDLGSSITGSTQAFPGGTFSVEEITFLSGEDAGVWSDNFDEQALQSGEKAFKFGNKYLTVSKGDNNVLVIICKAEFKGGIPDVPEWIINQYDWGIWGEKRITDENGEDLPGNSMGGYSDLVSSRYYVQANVSSREFPTKIKVHFLGAIKELPQYNSALSRDEVIEIAKEYVVKQGYESAMKLDYKEFTTKYNETDKTWEVSFWAKLMIGGYVRVKIDDSTGKVLEFEPLP